MLEKNNFNLELFFTFVIGLLLSPFSYGFVYYILYIIAYELFILFYNDNSYEKYQRLLIIGVSLIGFIIGRSIFYSSQDPILFQATKIDWSSKMKEIYENIRKKIS